MLEDAVFETRWCRTRSALFGALLVLLAIGCAERPASRATPEVGRVVLVGIDGATWRVIDPLVAAGQLPSFAGLMERGCRGSMKSLWPSISPRIWTSIATGVPPAEHGITGWVHKVEGRPRLFTSDMVRVGRVWDIASRFGRRVGVTNFWFTYPATPVNGYIISDHAIPARSARLIDFRTKGESAPPDRDRLTSPAALWRQIQGAFERRQPRIAIATQADMQTAPLSTLLREDEEVVEMAAAAAAAEGPPDLEMLYIRAVDGASHRFWIYYEPDHPYYEGKRPSAEEIERFGETIPGVYRHTDALLAEILAPLAPEDVVIVVSDHGHGAVPPSGEITGGHGRDPSTFDGIYLLAGGPVKGEGCPEEISLYDVAPTILHLLGLEVPTAMRGSVALATLEPSWIAAHPVRRSDAPLERPPAPALPSEIPEREEEHRLEMLRALGYTVD